jgi:hypothetical protein
MEAPRVPAWKRLGLKLKYAQDINTATSPLPIPQRATPNGIPATANLNGQANGRAVTPPPSKKRRLDEHASTPADDAPDGLKRSSSLKSSRPNVRKSVSFTPETKEDDGESANFMQDKWDQQAQDDQINEFLAREAENAEAALKLQTSAVEPGDESSLLTAVKKPKREKKDKRPAEQATLNVTSHPAKSTGKSKDALDYLEQYQSSRSTWKFNKNREVWLLKHILSKSDIPSPYESALSEYLSGMKSENAKARLIEQCHDCIVEKAESGSDESDRALISKSLKLDSTARRVAYYRAANQRFESAFQSTESGEVSQKDRDLARERHEQVDRAAKLLESMLGAQAADIGANETSEPQPAEVLSQKQTASDRIDRKPVVKKRKNRTAVVDISSSDDTSSDSSSDSNTE